MNRNTVAVLKVSVLTMAILICGCQSVPYSKIPTAVDTFYRAHQAHDAAAVRSMIAPSIRDDPDFKSLANDLKAIEIISWKIGAIEPMEAASDDNGHLFPTAKVPMEVLAKSKSQDRPTIQKDQVDYWVLVDGKWFWFWVGFPAD